MRTTTKSFAVAAVASLAMLTAACGASDSEGDEAVNPAADLVGSGCADYAKAVPDGAGSISGMSREPVTEAASNNPLLTTFTEAVSGRLNPAVDLVGTLNGGQFTVFAPVDDAFAKLPATTLDSFAGEAGGTMLSSVLTYHVIPERLAPANIDGTFKTVNGADLTITGSADDIRVGNRAAVICGGIQTAHATVYLIDTVLAPPG